MALWNDLNSIQFHPPKCNAPHKTTYSHPSDVRSGLRKLAHIFNKCSKNLETISMPPLCSIVKFTKNAKWCLLSFEWIPKLRSLRPYVIWHLKRIVFYNHTIKDGCNWRLINKNHIQRHLMSVKGFVRDKHNRSKIILIIYYCVYNTENTST